jgi:hypothetical protein
MREKDTSSHLTESAKTRKTLDERYDEIESGRVTPVDGEAAFERVRAKSFDRRNGRVSSSPTKQSR